MATIRQQIEVAALPARTASVWTRFVRWAHNGPGRLVCDQLSCVDAVRAGLVDFSPGAGGTTLVVFRLDCDEGAPPLEELERELRHDLVAFKDYVERSGLDGRRATAAQAAAADIHAGRRGDVPRHTRLSTEDGVTFRRSHFPT